MEKDTRRECTMEEDRWTVEEDIGKDGLYSGRRHNVFETPCYLKQPNLHLFSSALKNHILTTTHHKDTNLALN